jgi:hypothetical protein
MLLLGVVEGNLARKETPSNEQPPPLSCDTTPLLLVGGYFLLILLTLAVRFVTLL